MGTRPNKPVSVTLIPTPTLGAKVKWVDDPNVSHCPGCGVEFTLVWRKHHCRSCGEVVCGECSMGRRDGLRTCDGCWFRVSELWRRHAETVTTQLGLGLGWIHAEMVTTHIESVSLSCDARCWSCRLEGKQGARGARPLSQVLPTAPPSVRPPLPHARTDKMWMKVPCY